MVAATTFSVDTPPCISPKTVKSTLDALARGSPTKGERSLDKLLLVDEVLSDGSFPSTPYQRWWALSEVLTTLIAEKLTNLRNALDIPCVETKTLEDAKRLIACDMRVGNTELLGWSWLYYRYAQAEFEFRQEQFCHVASINLRTLGRYQDQAIWRLTMLLVERERHIRKLRQKRWLYTQLPKPYLPLFVGRKRAIAQTKMMLNHLRPRHLQISGGEGVGKTAFTQQIVCSLIDSSAVDQLLWIGKPFSARELQHGLQEMLYRQGIHTSLREYSQQQQVIVVIDDLDSLCDEYKLLEAILDDLGAATVFLTAHHPLRLPNLMGHIALSQLPETEAKQLIRTHLDYWHIQNCDSVTSEEVELIWQQTGGIPQLIEKAIFLYQERRCAV